MLSNISNLCRLCLTREDSLLSVFCNSEFSNAITGHLDLSAKVMSFTSIEITENDGLPSQICQQCVIEVNRCYNFKKRCENTDATLRQCFRTLQSSVQSLKEEEIKQEIGMNEENTFNKDDSMIKENRNKSSVTGDIVNEKQKLTDNSEFVNQERADVLGTSHCYQNETSNVTLVSDCDDGVCVSNSVITRTCNMEQENISKLYPNTDNAVVRSDDRTILLKPLDSGKVNIPLTQVITVDGKRFHQCLICSKRFGHKSHLTDHVRVHTREKAYHCPICNKSYTQKSSYTYHRALHKGDKPHVCLYCDKSFSHKSHLINHTRLHTGEKPYSCSVCGNAFRLHSSLRSHLHQHMGVKPYECTYCKKTYSKRSSLTYHLGLHKPQKSHECVYCNRKFSHKSHLKVHIRIHTGDKPYTCSECGQAFSLKSTLASHLQHHSGETPYSCHVCNKVYSKRSSFAYHLGLHKEDKPHQCSFCGKLFSHKSHLTNHTRLHTGEKPFLCNVCGQAFAVQSTLTVHLKRRHALKELKETLPEN